MQFPGEQIDLTLFVVTAVRELSLGRLAMQLTLVVLLQKARIQYNVII